MSKQIKRKITMNLSLKNKNLPKNRPSVFERLGTKTSSMHKEYCHHWAQNGTCPYGKSCKYSVTHTLVSPSKQRAAKKENESKKQHTKDVHKRLRGEANSEGNEWDPAALANADPDVLEKRREEIRRELGLQFKMENKARKKEKLKKESSPSSESSSSSSDSSSTTDDSSSSSSSSVETKRRKVKKTKKRESSSSSESERARSKHKSKTRRRQITKLIARPDKMKALPPKLSVKVAGKSPSPGRSRKQSRTPPLKIKALAPMKKPKSESKSPRPVSRSSDQKEKRRTPSPKVSKEKEREREREREHEKEREREREKERQKERERQREREREHEREREREREREKEREQERAKERAREQEKEQKKKESCDNKTNKDTKKKDSPDSSHSRDRKSSPSRSRGSGSSSSRRDARKNSPLTKDNHKRDYQGKHSKPTADGKRPGKRDSRDRDRERERERERRIAREEREAAREKEREEALARCQERQRERERLKELAKKEEEHRNRDRERREDRGLDKPHPGRTERLLPLPSERVSLSARKDSLERGRNDHRERERRNRTPNRGISADRHNRLDRVDKDRPYERSYEQNREMDHDLEREYSSLPRLREDRDLDKHYDIPYDHARHEDRHYMNVGHYNENSRDNRLALGDYTDDRSSRRDMWDEHDIERERELEHRRYREDSRPSPALKGRDWGEDYPEQEWERNRRPMDWETRDSWGAREQEQIPPDDDWRHYNRSVDSWGTDDRRRWPADWRERERERSHPRSVTSHREDEPHVDTRRKEPTKQEPNEPVTESKKEASASSSSSSSCSSKRPAEPVLESENETKKLKKDAPLDDDLSEISDDADEILNMDEELNELIVDEVAPDDATNPEDKESSQPAQLQKPESPRQAPLRKEESLDEDNAVELDFEEISEDELEEETRVKGLGDALGVDWASLVADSRPRIKPVSSAKRRWESHNVLVNLGISVEMAGEDLVKDILKEHAEAKAQEEFEGEIKKENGIKTSDHDEISVKTKPQTHNEIKISHPIAAVQVANREHEAVRKSMFASAGPFRRALSARRDLTIRRHLCNLPIKDTFAEAPKRYDPELFKMARQLFERCL